MPDDRLPYPAQTMQRLKDDATYAVTHAVHALCSCFPLVEGIFLASSFYQATLWFVADREKMARRGDRIDFLFCELFPEYTNAYMNFFAGGPPLNEILTQEETRRCEHAMFCLMAIAVTLREADYRAERSPVSWPAVVAAAREMSAENFDLAQSALPQ